jgi:hypothetical protein
LSHFKGTQRIQDALKDVFLDVFLLLMEMSHSLRAVMHTKLLI